MRKFKKDIYNIICRKYRRIEMSSQKAADNLSQLKNKIEIGMKIVGLVYSLSVNIINTIQEVKAIGYNENVLLLEDDTMEESL